MDAAASKVVSSTEEKRIPGIRPSNSPEGDPAPCASSKSRGDGVYGRWRFAPADRQAAGDSMKAVAGECHWRDRRDCADMGLP
jgi:hypothetical protein